MRLVDVIYRAFSDYSKNTKEDKECAFDKSYIISSNSEKDSIKSISYDITIEKDWIETIEKGLEFVDKCISECHQFIRVNGEVVKIEKVKRVSRESFVHLAKHSNLIRRYTPGKAIIPDELFMTEKISDYAVYENRFLYLLLCYLRDFISYRYDEILEYSNKYHSILEMNKDLYYGSKKLKYNVVLDEQINNDEYKIKINPNKEIIERIKNMISSVNYYLKTELMVEVSKVPVLKPPIIKTNVLKMNQNFKKAVELYEYITGYDKKGFEIEKKVKNISPFPKEIADDFADTIELQKFLVYQYSNDIKKELKNEYLYEQARRNKEEREKKQQLLKMLKHKLDSSELSIDEYLFELEQQNKSLEHDSKLLYKAVNEIKNLNNKVEELNIQIKNLKIEIDRLNQIIIEKNREIENLINQHKIEIQKLIEKYENQIQELIDDYNNKIQNLIDEYEQKIEELHTSYKQQIDDLTISYEKQILELNLLHDKEITQLKENYEKELNEQKTKYELKISNLLNEKEEFIKSKQIEIDAIHEKHQKEMDEMYANLKIKDRMIQERDQINKKFRDLNSLYYDEKHVLLAELNVMRQKTGQKELLEDFTTEERFKELERELAIFKKIFRKEWQSTKKRIYREVKESVLNTSKGNKQ